VKPRPPSTRPHGLIVRPPRPLSAAALPTAALAAVLVAAVIGCATTTTYRNSGSPSRSSRPSASGSPSAPPSQSFGTFAGAWSGHGGGLIIQPDGRFTISNRTYRWCSQDPPPCDAISGSNIINGDVQTGRLTSISGEVATGQVTHTTDPVDGPTGPITMTLDPATDTISAANVSYCGPNAPAGNCGA
jgi:hypothetical protein